MLQGKIVRRGSKNCGDMVSDVILHPGVKSAGGGGGCFVGGGGWGGGGGGGGGHS